MGPALIRSKLGIMLLLMQSSGLIKPLSSLDKPLLLLTRKILCRTGLRISASTMTTLAPVCAMVMARLEQVVDLPALGSALVTTTAFSAAVDSMNSRLARIAL